MDTPAQLKEPVEITREELHEQVWSTSMSQLATRYGISGNGLKKICDRLEIPYPSLGHWAKKAAGHDVPIKPLPKAGADTPEKVTITPTPPPPAPPTVAPEVREKIESLSAEIGPIPDSLEKPHPLIAAWMKDMERRRKDAQRRGADAYFSPGDLTEMHQRQLRILNALFKALVARRVRITEASRNQFVLEHSDEKIEIQLRERQRKTLGRRPAAERHRAFPGDTTPRDDMEGTGRLVFAIKTYLPGNLRCEWVDSEDKPMETHLPEIAGTIISAFPLLVMRTQERREAERQRQIAEHRRYQEQQRRKLEDNRWRRLTEIARQWEEVELARRYLAALRCDPSFHPDEVAGARSVQEWLDWTEGQLAARDPLYLDVSRLKAGRGVDWEEVMLLFAQTRAAVRAPVCSECGDTVIAASRDVRAISSRSLRSILTCAWFVLGAVPFHLRREHGAY